MLCQQGLFWVGEGREGGTWGQIKKGGCPPLCGLG